jgi:hypothetical protein
MEQTPWINEEKIRVGQIGPEETPSWCASLPRIAGARTFPALTANVRTSCVGR